MKPNTVGKVLRYYREKHKLSLETVCRGICSPQTLSRIELGTRNADSLTCQTLLERLGQEISQFELFLNETDFHLWKMRCQINRLLDNQSWNKIEIELLKYEQQMPFGEKLHEQFVNYVKIRTILEQSQSFPDLDIFTQYTIDLTGAKKEYPVESELYSIIELYLIFSLLKLKKEPNFEEKLLQLIYFAEQHYSTTTSRKIVVPMIMELIYYYQRNNNLQEIMNYSQYALETISQGRTYSYVADLHFIRAQTLYQMHLSKPIDNTQKRSICEECYMAYCVYQAENREAYARKVTIFLMEKLNVKL